MKDYQWAIMMFVLCMIAYYVSNEDLGPLICGTAFMIYAVIDLIFPYPGKKEK